MILDVEFVEDNQSFDADFGEVYEISDGSGGTYIPSLDWEDIENKPFDETKKFEDIVIDSLDYRVMTDTYELYNQQMRLVKIGELPSTSSEFISEIHSIGVIGTDLICTDNMKKVDEKCAAIVASKLIYVAAIDEPNFTYNNITYPEAGIYVLDNIGVGFLSYITFKSIITPLPEKYMPESYGELQDDVEQLQEDVKNATPSDYETVKEDVNNIKTDVNKLKEDVKNATPSDYNTVKTDVSNLKTDVSNLKTDVSNLKTDVSNLKTKSCLPTVTEEDDGKFLMVIGGEWVKAVISDAEGVTV